ncbi:MAG: exosortase/archaeosortase family protein [Planctomycetes bacterium]|nr:exosortase/archaeosortase family protein [Planctomycetota bacterium]
MSRFAVFFLPLLIAYAATLHWMWEVWTLPESYYSHGPLVPLVAALVVWARAAAWRDLPAATDLRGFRLLAPALALHLAAAALTIDSLSAASLVLAVPGAAWLALGAARARALAPVLGLTAFCVPLPLFVSGRVAFTLKEWATGAALTLANGTGLGATRAGAFLHVPGQDAPLLVADACGGLRSLVALATLGYCIAFFLGEQRGARRWILLALALPIAFVVNVVRIVALCWLARLHSVEFAAGNGHDLVNALAWIVALVLLVLCDRLLSRRRA